MGRKRVPGSVNNLYPFFHSSLSFHPFFFFFQVALITHLILQYILMCLLTTSPTRMQKVKSSLAYFPGDSVGRLCPQCRRLSAIQAIQVRSLGQKDPLQKETAIHSSVLGNPMDRGAWWATVRGVTEDLNTT